MPHRRALVQACSWLSLGAWVRSSRHAPEALASSKQLTGPSQKKKPNMPLMEPPHMAWPVSLAASRMPLIRLQAHKGRRTGASQERRLQQAYDWGLHAQKRAACRPCSVRLGPCFL